MQLGLLGIETVPYSNVSEGNAHCILFVLLGLLTTPGLQGQGILQLACQYVCLSVCLLASISQIQTSHFTYLTWLQLSRSSDDNAIGLYYV